jgi:hypothetical protein
MRNVLILLLIGVLAWTNRDRIPTDYQFWKKPETLVTVQNNSDQEVKDVVVHAWSQPYPLGAIPKGTNKNIRRVRPRDATDVVIRFHYGSEMIERHAGTLADTSGQRLVISLNYAGVVTSQVETGEAIQPLLR